MHSSLVTHFMNELIQVNTFIRGEQKTKLGSTFKFNFLSITSNLYWLMFIPGIGEMS